IEREALTAITEFSAYLSEIIKARRNTPQNDLISNLIAARDEGDKLTEDELIATCILLLNAGHEATVHTIGNGIHYLLSKGLRPNNPEEITEEILAADPPLHIFQRIAMQDVEIAGHMFKKDDRIALILGAAGTIPNPYQNNTKPSHLAFGLGRHFCVGAPLARLEVQTALPILFKRHPNMQLSEPPRYADRYHFRALEALKIAL
ncbi:MAG: cytochrome P450, partial [Pseudomonadota bacterium]